MEENNKKSNLIKVIIISAISLLLIGGTFAFTQFILLGNKENVIEIKGVTFTYEEDEEGLFVSNASALTDAQGIASGNDFTFEVTATSAISKTLYYNIYLTLLNNSDEFNDSVKVYLKNNTLTTTHGPFLIDELAIKDADKKEYYLHSTSFNLMSQVTSTNNYTLTIWLSNELGDSITNVVSGDRQTSIVNMGQFSFKIDVEASDEQMVVEETISPPTCVWGNGPTSLVISDTVTATYILNCTDSDAFSDSDILTTDFLVTGNSNVISVTNVTKTTITNGYSYEVTVTGTQNNGSAGLRLKSLSVSDILNNKNRSSAISRIITVTNE